LSNFFSIIDGNATFVEVFFSFNFFLSGKLTPCQRGICCSFLLNTFYHGQAKQNITPLSLNTSLLSHFQRVLAEAGVFKQVRGVIVKECLSAKEVGRGEWVD